MRSLEKLLMVSKACHPSCMNISECHRMCLWTFSVIQRSLEFNNIHRDEIEELQQRVLKERDQYQAATQSAFPGISAVPFFSVNDKVRR